jgi:predicted HicB family RNase H-like nuclease
MKLRIEKEEYMNKTFKLNLKLLRELEKICKEKGISLNKLVCLCMQHALENLDDSEDK